MHHADGASGIDIEVPRSRSQEIERERDDQKFFSAVLMDLTLPSQRGSFVQTPAHLFMIAASEERERERSTSQIRRRGVLYVHTP